MDRLTVKAPSGLIHLRDNKESTFNKAVKKLSDYEDFLVQTLRAKCTQIDMERMTVKAPSGLIHLQKEVIMDEAVKKLSDFEDLDENNLLETLFGKSGDKIWYIDDYEDTYAPRIVGGIVDGYLYFKRAGFAFDVIWDRPIMGHFGYTRRYMEFEKIGSSVFLTEDQAVFNMSAIC